MANCGALANPNSHGTNGLIKEGAKLVESMEDVLGELLMRLQIKSLVRELPGKLFCKR